MESLSTSPLGAEFAALTSAFDLGDTTTDQIGVTGRALTLGTPIRVVEAGVLALALQAVSVAALDTRVGRPSQDVLIRRDQVPPALRPFTFQTRNGELSRAWSSQIVEAPCTGHMATADGRHVYMANIVPRLRDGTLRLLGAAATREAVEAAVSKWNAFELEDAMNDAGLPLTVVRHRREWAASLQGTWMAAAPLVRIQRTDDAPPERLPRDDRALAGIRVLDFTHVVAGPMVTRGLAEYGADVVHVSPPSTDLRDPAAVTDEMLIGKRSIVLDMKSAEGRADAERLIRDADVVVHSWRPGVMERWGLGVERLAELRPGLVSLGISCYGPDGPWQDRPGFDGNALAATGVTEIEAQHTSHRLTPPGVLTDSLVGFAGVAAVNAMLRRRELDGGGRVAHLSLAGLAMWVLNLGTRPPESDEPPAVPRMRAAKADDGASVGFVDHPIDYLDRPARLAAFRPGIGTSVADWMS